MERRRIVENEAKTCYSFSVALSLSTRCTIFDSSSSASYYVALHPPPPPPTSSSTRILNLTGAVERYAYVWLEDAKIYLAIFYSSFGENQESFLLI